MRKPDFFIVGAARSGTTALYQYLREHPSVFMSPVKEPHFFSEDLFGGPRLSMSQYVRLFQGANEKHLVIGEASTSYLPSSVAAKKIHEFNPDARIVALLRSPVEMVYAFHSLLVWLCEEDERDFEKAWRLQASRRKGNHIPLRCRYPLSLQYSEICRLGAHVERLLRVFPREQVKLVLFDDFVRCTRTIYEDILSFLQVPSDGRTRFPKVNENRQPRLRCLGRFLRHPPAVVVRLFAVAKRALGVERTGLGVVLRGLNTRKKRRESLAPEFRMELVEEFREDVEKLSEMLGRDLTHWCEALDDDGGQ